MLLWTGHCAVIVKQKSHFILLCLYVTYLYLALVSLSQKAYVRSKRDSEAYKKMIAKKKI